MKQTMWKRFKKGTIATLIATSVLSTSTAVLPQAEVAAATPIKNVIILIPDGMANDATTLARWYKGSDLALDELASGLVRTYSADAPIADSAPAGTAFATGHKSHTGFVGVLPDEATMPGQAAIAENDKRKPVASVLEAARLAGKSTGIIATSEFMHATPADFSAHYPDRSNYDALSMQQVYNDMDVVLGSGSNYLTPEGRKDGNDLLSTIKERGYEYVTTPEQLKASSSDKIWGMFGGKALAYEMDRDPAKQPSLSDMTSKAIDVLSQNDKGFFLMVEGSKVDWAAHANDPVGVISDVLAFDEAVNTAVQFAKKDHSTAVIAVTDHGNGGLTIGSKATTSTYDKEPLASFITPLKNAKVTGEGFESKLNADRSNIEEAAATYLGITDLSAEEIQTIKDAKAGSMNYAVGPIISERANIGWTTGGHTGGDVVLYTYAPDHNRPTGVIENTDVAKYMASVLGLDLNATTTRLFVNAEQAFASKGAKTSIEDSKLIVTKGSDKLELPFHTSVASLNGQSVQLEGVIVYNGISVYASQQAIDLIK